MPPTDVGVQLLENAAATAGALIALIMMFATVSGAHFNPAVTLVDRLLGNMTTRVASLYVVAQLVGGCLGAMLTNLMYSEQTGRGIVFFSERERNSGAELISEVIATLVAIARTLSDTFAGIEPASAPAFVAAQITGALIAFALIPVLYHRTAGSEQA